MVRRAAVTSKPNHMYVVAGVLNVTNSSIRLWCDVTQLCQGLDR